MTAQVIDTLADVRRLEKAGVDPRQAEAITEVVAGTGESLATKSDVIAVKSDVSALADPLRHEMSVMRWMGGLLIGLVLAVLFRVW